MSRSAYRVDYFSQQVNNGQHEPPQDARPGSASRPKDLGSEKVKSKAGEAKKVGEGKKA